MYVPDPEFAELVSMESQELAKAVYEILAWVGGLLVSAITVLFGALGVLGKKVFDRQEALTTALMSEHNKTTAALTESVHRVETAIVRSDAANVAALASVTAAIGRIDKHEVRINTLDGTVSLHAHRIGVLENKAAT